ncbi:transposase [Microbulbifer sp. 2201CG32-9]|uniref:transposase n=1 Tax=Microbulbifer sp. 2201CG32-9 TaxID=3232309 RepID=UPI00345BE99C
MRSSCLPDSQKNRARFVYRSLHQSHIDKVRRRQSTRLFKSKLTERAWKVEGLFGEAKDNHCLRRAKYRGLANAQIQFYLTALTQNLKRVAAMNPFLRKLAIKILNMASWRAVQGVWVKNDGYRLEFLPTAVERSAHWEVG